MKHFIHLTSNSQMRHTTYFTRFIFACIPLLSFLLLYSCKSPQNQPATPKAEPRQIVFDSLQKTEIDYMIDYINAELRKIGLPQKLPYTIHNPTDTIYYWIIDGTSARISIEMSPPEQTIWPTFFVHKGDLVLVRYRYFTPPAPSYVSESMIYLKQGKVVYCEERRMDLNQGEQAGLLRRQPFSKSQRSLDEIEKDYLEHWTTIRNYMKHANVLPAIIAN